MGKSSTPTNSSDAGIRLIFADLGKDETPPDVALYSVGADGKPTAKIAHGNQGILPVPPQRLKGRIAIGPNVQDLNELTADRLIMYRAEQIAKDWAAKGLVLPRARWTVFWPLFRCVSGHVRKCRPWWWDIIDITAISASIGAKLSKSIALKTQASGQISLASQVSAIRYFPWRCVPLCDGIIEIYERECCCFRIDLPDLIERLRRILEQIPLPWPPIPDPDPWPEPDPGPDPAPFGRIAARRFQGPTLASKAPAGTIARSPDPTLAPPQRLYEAYADLQRLPAVEAERYALERPWLYPFFCSCSSRKVGEVPIQPGGNFDFCYLRGLVPFRCYLTYAYRIRQLIGGVWTTVYDGVASGAWFAADEEADIRVTNPRALPCGDPSSDPPPNEGNPFVMLEHVTGAGTHHFNFPTQTGVSQLGAPDIDDGLYTTGYAPDCPWASTLGLRLWVSPELRGKAAYYRMSVIPVDSAGVPTGARVVLDDPVSWSKFVLSGTDWVVEGQGLGPNTVGGEASLFVVPYWADGNWLSGQYHQLWNTAAFANGRYMLIIEVFDPAGARIKPTGATGPGANQAFQFLRWSSDTTTANVPFADCAHLFWIDNKAVDGDIVDLRQNGLASSDECQFMTGTPSDQFSIGYRAYHVNGISNADSFMYWHTIAWQRGLNGPSGNLAPEVSPTTDAGESGPPAQSGSATFGAMLGTNDRCSFSVTLSVYAKHWNGGTRLSGYDYYETASFALDQTGP